MNMANILEIVTSPALTLSFEVFPPKANAAAESVMRAAQAVAALKPAYVSVTYGAGGGTSAYTVQLAQSIEQDYRLPVLTHLTCVSSSHEAVRAQVQRMQEANLTNVLALRGDIPEAMADADRSQWSYRHASDLISELRGYGSFCVGAACYPEKHPESADTRADLDGLRRKIDAGADFLTTQMFFDNDLFFRFMYHLRDRGITAPVVPGIMPITDARQVQRAITLSGCSVPKRFLSLVDRFGHEPEAMRQAGIAYATDQIIDLYANGIRHVHVYTMNKPDVAARIQANLTGILGSVW